MIGQQKRLLEHIPSSQPVKYQKQSDEKMCEAHTRVASLTDEKLEFEQHFSEVSQKNEFSVAPGANGDSMKVFERVIASELRVSQKDKDASEPEIGVSGGSRDGSVISNDRGVVRMAENSCSQSAKESEAEGHEEDMGHSYDRVNETQSDETVGVGQLMRDAEFPPFSGSGALTSEDGGKNDLSLLGSPSGDLTVELFGDEPIGLIQGPQYRSAPSTAENDTEDGACYGTVDSRSARCSQSPLPVHMSEKVIDLYAMDEQVQSYGGYEVVTSDGLWGNISEALGLGSDCGPGLKLIYFKHLRNLERDRRLPVERHHGIDLIDAVNMRGPILPNDNGLLDDEKDENYSLTDSEQFAESEPHNDKLGEHPVNGRSSTVSREDPLDVDQSEDETEIGSVKRGYGSAKLHSEYRTGGYPFMGSCTFSQECQDCPEAFLSDYRGCVDHDRTLPAKEEGDLGSNDEEHGLYDVAAIERINKSLTDTLIWIKRMAVEPGNPDMGQGPEGIGQNQKWVAECASQAKKIRTLLWRRRDDVRQGDGHSHQAKQQIPSPSHYYEDSTRQEQQAPDRPRRERAAHHGSTSAQKPFNEAANFERNSSPSFNQQPQWVGQTSQRLSRQSHVHYYHEEGYSEEFIDRPPKRVPIGMEFQAHVPTFTSVDRHPGCITASGIAGHSGDETQSSDESDEEDDSRWLGQRVWPPPGSKKFPHKDHYVGRSRPSFCSCPIPESLNCVRVHIEEERDRLKQELGQAFYIWKFDQVGESVAGKWTKEEQRTYEALVRLNPPSRHKNFWDDLPEAFPDKTMKELVSYYFNVFVLRRRAIQNRLDNQQVDSDDDEKIYPDCDSEDSDDYESGDEGDEEEEDQDLSEDEDETDKEVDGPYGSDSSAKLLEDTGFCHLGGYSSKMEVISSLDEAQGVPMTVRTARLMNFVDVEVGYHDPHQEEIDDRLRAAHMTAEWSHVHDDEKQLEDDHISMVGEEELQEVKTWEASHWDEADHDDLGHEPAAKSISSKGEQTPERDSSALYKKAVDGTNQHPSLVGSCDGGVWGPTIDVAPINKRDKLLSTNGMIQELFGNEASGLNAST